jgi:hypothetical protein
MTIKPGITMPNNIAQGEAIKYRSMPIANVKEEDLIRSVYKKGGMDPADTGYVEAHGKYRL